MQTLRWDFQVTTVPWNNLTLQNSALKQMPLDPAGETVQDSSSQTYLMADIQSNSNPIWKT